MTVIADFTDHLEYPNVDGIVFPDGRIQLVDLSVDWEGSRSVDWVGTRPNFKSELGETTTAKALDLQGELLWNSGAIVGKATSDDGTLEVLGGEANWGSDGFVALIDTATRKLVWLAAFQTSNPFQSNGFKEDCVYAESTYGNVWRFPVNDPCQFTVD